MAISFHILLYQANIPFNILLNQADIPFNILLNQADIPFNILLNQADVCDTATCLLPECYCSADGTIAPGQIMIELVNNCPRSDNDRIS